MKYILHDTSALDDEKLTKVFMEFGYEGTGLFWAILEKLGKQEKPIDTDVLKSQLKVRKKLEKCWKFLEEIGIISSNNGETFNKQLLNFSEKYKIKSEKNSKRISEWRDKQMIVENVTRYESVCNAPKVKESKVNRSKVNIEREIKIDFIFKNDSFKKKWADWKKYRNDELKKDFKTNQSEQASLNHLFKISNGNDIIAEEIIAQSMANQWQGLFEIKNKSNGTNKQINGEASHGAKNDSAYEFYKKISGTE